METEEGTVLEHIEINETWRVERIADADGDEQGYDLYECGEYVGNYENMDDVRSHIQEDENNKLKDAIDGLLYDLDADTPETARKLRAAIAALKGA